MIDVHAVNQKKKQNKTKKKVHRFLQKKKMIDVHAVKKIFFLKSIQILTIGKKKIIDVHTINQKKANKVHRFLQYERKK